MSAILSIARAIAYAFAAIMHFIEIPFKILYAYGLLLKPYVIILGNHIAMTGNDFSHGIDSFEKAAVLLSSSK